MPLGTLPIRYLGLPLISTRLSFIDCQQIFNKMQQTLHSWVTKRSSYGGRLQLIKTVLNGIQLYYTSVFILPKVVIKNINNLMASFLWSREIKFYYCAKVKWYDVSLPKKEGGLGLFDMVLWNKYLILKKIWNIYSKKGNLWVKRIHTVSLKGASFWGIKEPADCS